MQKNKKPKCNYGETLWHSTARIHWGEMDDAFYL